MGGQLAPSTQPPTPNDCGTMKRFYQILGIAVLGSSLAPAANGAVVSTGGGFEVSYSGDLRRGTLHGSDITNLFILESDGATVHVDSGFTVPARGPFTLAHEVPFAPTSSLIVGLDLAPAGSGLVDHLVVFMDDAFAEDALRLPKFSDIFPAIDGRERLRHSGLVQALKDAEAGDGAAVDVLVDFFTLDAGKFAAFDPGDSFRVLEFSPPKCIDRCDDSGATLALFSFASLAAIGLRRKLRR